MKNPTRSFLAMMLVCTGCNFLVTRVALGIENPKFENIAEQKKYLGRQHLATDNLFYLNEDSIQALKFYKPDFSEGFRPIQFKLFDRSGKLIVQYANCEGPINRYLDTFPIRNIYPAYENNTLQRELGLIKDENGNIPGYQDIMDVNTDYLIVAYWAEFMGVLSRKMLMKLESYQTRYADKRIKILKLNISTIDTE